MARNCVNSLNGVFLSPGRIMDSDMFGCIEVMIENRKVIKSRWIKGYGAYS